MEPVMSKKAKRKLPPKPKIRKVESAPGGKRKPGTSASIKDKEELIRIWDEDLCE
jgi:hypothetical protein